ncbi:Dyp-type peroxidase [Immundisolibacter sp.]|uniref:Dyp-type peroxidase n=1 Tax=Immundisolibacter sp. TaxID=1934948 RepID=UPI00356344E8
MTSAQAGILLPPPPLAVYLSFDLAVGSDVGGALARLCTVVDGEQVVAGLGSSVAQALGQRVQGLRPFTAMSGPGVDVPATPAGLWLWLRGGDRGQLLHRARQLEAAVLPAFYLREAVDGFQYQDGQDLTGFEDGTENPKDQAAEAAAVVQGRGPGLDGSSFVAVQRWVHELSRFDALSAEQQDLSVGRHRKGNEEIADAPPSAHVKRTAQETFTPPAFVLRRSMPWANGLEAGLMFVAFGHSFDAFEAQLRRMVGAEDGITDALFRFTRPVTGAFFWCPPVTDGRLDLRALGLG